jgi:tRNA (mo5U34)-methyltransferase
VSFLSTLWPARSDAKVVEEMFALRPWRIDVEVRTGITTGSTLGANGRATEPRFERPKKRFEALLTALYPGGLQERSVLDCRCNCGAYLFWARELGAGRCLGLEVHERWLAQAKFLRRRRPGTRGLRFELAELDELPEKTAAQFDLTLFNGVFQQLRAPIEGLAKAARQTREIIVVTTATRTGLPDSMLAPWSVPSNLRWLPSGPRTIERVLRWAGFEATRLTRYSRLPWQRPGRATIEIVAAREEATLRSFDATRAERARRALEAVVASVPRGATVLVAAAGEEALLELDGRRAWHFPRSPDGTFTSFHPDDSEAAIEHLEALREEGAQYILFPASGLWWLEVFPGLGEHLRRTYAAVGDRGEEELLFDLTHVKSPVGAGNP